MVGYSASDVLSGVLSAWHGSPPDGPNALKRCLPQVDFPGFGMVDEVSLDGALATSQPTLLKNRSMIIPATVGDEHVLVSARIDSNGTLTYVNTVRAGAELRSAIVEAAPGRIVFEIGGGRLKTCAVAADGTLGEPAPLVVVPKFVHLTMLTPGLFLASADKLLQTVRIDARGTVTTVGGGANEHHRSDSDLPSVYRGIVVIRTSSYVKTFVRVGGAFELVDSLHIEPFGSTGRPAFISQGGTAVFASNAGDHLWTYRIGENGAVTEGCHKAMVSLPRGSPLFVNDHVVMTDVFGCVQTLAPDGRTFRQVGKAIGDFTTRPTVTRDGLVLVGTKIGDVAALELGADGSLTERTRKPLGAPIRVPLTVTADGYVVVCAGDKLITLRGAQ